MTRRESAAPSLSSPRLSAPIPAAASISRTSTAPAPPSPTRRQSKNPALLRSSALPRSHDRSRPRRPREVPRADASSSPRTASLSRWRSRAPTSSSSKSRRARRAEPSAAMTGLWSTRAAAARPRSPGSSPTSAIISEKIRSDFDPRPHRISVRPYGGALRPRHRSPRRLRTTRNQNGPRRNRRNASSHDPHDRRPRPIHPPSLPPRLLRASPPSIKKKGTDYSVPNPRAGHRRRSRFSGQSGLSPFSLWTAVWSGSQN